MSLEEGHAQQYGHEPLVARYIAEGFSEDVLRLINAFAAKNSYEFKVFAELWRDANFSLVYMGRETEKELREFTVESFNIILGYLSPITLTRMKVGALYMLYSMYLKQITVKNKIRIRHQHWSEMKGLFEFGKRERHYSICYIINQLLEIGALHFVHSPMLMGPRVSMSADRGLSAEEILDVYKDNLKEVVDNNELLTLADAHELYESLKESFLDFCPEIIKKLPEAKYIATHSKFETLLNAENLDELQLDDDDDDDEAPQNDDFDDGIGVRRAAIKKTQYQTLHDSSRNKRTEEMLSTTEDEAAVHSAPDEQETVSQPVGKMIGKKGRRKKRNAVRGKRKTKGSTKAEPIADDEDDPVPVASTSMRGTRKRKAMGRRIEKCRKTRYHYATQSDSDDMADVLQEHKEEVD